MFLKKVLLTFVTASVMAFAGTVIDREGNEYLTISIEGYDQEWMAEDLLVGSASKVDWTTAMDISSNYLNDFYDGGSPVQGVCPDGWRLPTAQEWETLLESFTLGREDCGYDDCTSKSWDLYALSNSGLDLPSKGGYWTSTQTMDLDGAQGYANGVKIDGSGISLERLVSKDEKLKIRCIYREGDNYQEYDSDQESETDDYGSEESCPDIQALNLSVAITDEYMVIGARGGFQPNVYYRTMPSRNGIRYVTIQKESGKDPGRLMWGLYSSKNGALDSVYLDGSGNLIMGVGDGVEGRKPPALKQRVSSGKIVGTLAPNSLRSLSSREYNDAIVAPLSAFDVIARDLTEIHSRFMELSDADDLMLVINAEDASKDALKKRLRTYRPLMQSIKNAGYTYVLLATIELNYKLVRGGENASQADMMAFFREMYDALGLKMPSEEEMNKRRTKNLCQNKKSGVLKLLTAQTKNASAGGYDLMKNQKFSKDIDKVLNDVAGLQTTGKSQLGGRRGKADGGSNEGYAEGGIGDGLAGLLGGKAKGSIKTPSERDIDMGAGDGSRGKAEIMKVMRQRTPGLRHTYNKFLKKRPGFSGRVTLKFTIAPGGEIISISIASSTTGYAEFDNEIKNAVSRWTFGVIKSGITTVTLPFTFAE